MFSSDYAKAVDLHMAGKFPEALELYTKILAKNPYHISAWNNSACVKDDLGNITGAFADINRAIQICPEYGDAYHNRAYLHKKCKSNDLAIHDYTKAIALGVSNIAVTYRERAACFENMGMFDNALNDYYKAIELKENIDWLIDRARVYQKKKFYEQAENDLNRALRINPDYGKVYYGFGNLYSEREYYDLAIDSYTMAIAMGYLDSCAFGGRAFCYICLNLFDAAEKDYSKAIELDPKNQNRLIHRAKLYLKKDLDEQAFDGCCKAVKMWYPEYDAAELVTLVYQDRMDEGIKACKCLLCDGHYLSFEGDTNKKFIVKPWTDSNERIVLPLNNLHIGKTNRRYLEKYGDLYELRYDSDFDSVMDNIYKKYYEKNDDYLPILRHLLTAINKTTNSPRAVSVALYKGGELVAGEVGIQIGRIYTSYTGYHDEPYAGIVQIILLAQLLEGMGVDYIDFGPSIDRWNQYKFRLGAEKMSFEAYISLFKRVNSKFENIFEKSEKLSV